MPAAWATSATLRHSAGVTVGVRMVPGAPDTAGTSGTSQACLEKNLVRRPEILASWCSRMPEMSGPLVAAAPPTSAQSSRASVARCCMVESGGGAGSKQGRRAQGLEQRKGGRE